MTGEAQDPRDGRDEGRDSANEPSHEAVGIGVIHDERGEETTAVAAAGAEPADTSVADDALDGDQERRLPTMSHDPATLDTVSGVVAQTRQDTGTAPQERIVDVLRDRLQQAGVELDDAEIEELARQVSMGDSDDAD